MLFSVRFTYQILYVPGTKTVSPGFCKISKGLNSGGQVGSCVLGYMTLNHVIASSCWFPPSSRVTLISSLGVLVGNRHQRLCPWTKAFHALVPKGSMWIPVPDRGGPITNHLHREEKKKSFSQKASCCLLFSSHFNRTGIYICKVLISVTSTAFFIYLLELLGSGYSNWYDTGLS